MANSFGGDRFTEVTRTGCLGNLVNSVVGALFGLLLFFGSFFLLWWNEGRENLALTANKSVVIEASAVHPEVNGKLVAAGGTLTAPGLLGDAGLLRPGSYLQLERQAEMFAWEEKEESHTEKQVGGGSTTTTTYTYTKHWTGQPDDSSSFRHPQGHTNPPLAASSQTFTVAALKLGAYAVDPQALDFPPAQPLPLSRTNVIAPAPWRLEGKYLIKRKAGATGGDQVGDTRLSYAAVPNKIRVTLLAQAQGDRLVPFSTRKSQIYRAFTGNREQAIGTLQQEYTTLLWILRVVGFVLMWIGLSLCFGPLNQVFNIVPLVGDAAGCFFGATTFAVALVLASVTIVVGYIAHNLVALAIAIVLALIGFALFARRGQRGRSGGPPPLPPLPPMRG